MELKNVSIFGTVMVAGLGIGWAASGGIGGPPAPAASAAPLPEAAERSADAAAPASAAPPAEAKAASSQLTQAPPAAGVWGVKSGPAMTSPKPSALQESEPLPH